MTREYRKEVEWPPRFTWAWNGILLRITAMYQNNDPGGLLLLDALREFLDRHGPPADDFVKWAREQEKEVADAVTKEKTDG